MNLPIINPPKPMAAWRFLLETLTDGRVTAWVAELPECRVTAESREAAIADLETMVHDRIGAIEELPSPIQPRYSVDRRDEAHPEDSELFARRQALMSIPKLDQHDPGFIEFMAELRASRELEDDNPAYTINW
jgi:hypothetical protein